MPRNPNFIWPTLESQPAKTCAGEQPDYTWALGKITGDHMRDGVGGGGIIGYSGRIYCNNVG